MQMVGSQGQHVQRYWDAGFDFGADTFVGGHRRILESGVQRSLVLVQQLLPVLPQRLGVRFDEQHDHQVDTQRGEAHPLPVDDPQVRRLFLLLVEVK